MEGGRVTMVSEVVYIRRPFREGPLGRVLEQVLAFMVYERSSEDLVLSNPQLNDLGYHSSKFEVEP